MLSYKQYKILRLINQYTKDSKHDDSILHKITMYEKSTRNTILKALEDKGYISDIFNDIPDNLKTIEITEEGKVIIQDYWKYQIKIFLARIFWLILGSIVTIIIQFAL